MGMKLPFAFMINYFVKKQCDWFNWCQDVGRPFVHVATDWWQLITDGFSPRNFDSCNFWPTNNWDTSRPPFPCNHICFLFGTLLLFINTTSL